MTDQQTRVATEVAALSAAGRIHFGEVVDRLTRAGIERYHADYSRMENTYYAVDGGSCVVPLDHGPGPSPVALTFVAGEVEAAVRRSQRGEIRYPEFVRLTLAAGCVGYFVQLTGRCVQYFGREGQVHTEWFPGAPAGGGLTPASPTTAAGAPTADRSA